MEDSSEPTRLTRHKDQVRRFYRVLWDAHDRAEIPSVLHEDFTFRGSLGEDLRGHQEFAGYVDRVHAALGAYRCLIEELVAEGSQVVAKMKFTGIHKGVFLGYSPTGKRVSWSGCAVFTFRDDKVSDLWVLGDLKSLEDQLRQDSR